MNLNGRAHPQPGRCDKTRETLSVIHDPAGEVEGPRAHLRIASRTHSVHAPHATTGPSRALRKHGYEAPRSAG
jgi:hypothetical protein